MGRWIYSIISNFFYTRCLKNFPGIYNLHVMDQGSLGTFKSFSLLQFNRRFLVTVAMALTEESVVKLRCWYSVLEVAMQFLSSDTQYCSFKIYSPGLEKMPGYSQIWNGLREAPQFFVKTITEYQKCSFLKVFNWSSIDFQYDSLFYIIQYFTCSQTWCHKTQTFAIKYLLFSQICQIFKKYDIFFFSLW